MAAPAQDDRGPGTTEVEGLDEEVLRALEAAIERESSGAGFTDGFEDLFLASALAYGSQGPLLQELDRRLTDPALDEIARRRIEWIAIDILSRRGDQKEALERCAALRDQFEEEGRSNLAVTLRCARLLDKSGKERLAEPVYDDALRLASASSSTDLEQAVRLRIALFDLDRSDGGSAVDRSAELRAFASGDGVDPEFRNQAANVLALTGDHEGALELARVDTNLRPQQQIRWILRRAEWAIQADQAETAQELAWEARSRANLARDRRYALTLLVEAHNLDGSLRKLSERFAREAELDDESMSVFIDVLRRTGEVEQAAALFRSRSSELDLEAQRELVEIYREAGREEEMLQTYRDLIAERPQSVDWRRGLARHYLENGDRENAVAVFEDYVRDESRIPFFVTAAEAMAGLGLDELAEQTVQVCVERRRNEFPALLFLFDLRRERGDLEGAVEALQQLDELARADDGVRVQIAESFERIGKADEAVRLLEGLRAARGDKGLAEDLEMRLAWLYSEVGREEDAFARWQELWLRAESLPRRRYAEDRLMTIGSRLGQLADVVIELEKKLQDGTADERDAGLLVSLYTKVNDAVSATEIVEEQVKVEGGDSIETLKRQANVFLACTDYSSYEDTLRDLIEVDPENEADYLRSLVLSVLERGEPSEARPVLERLKALDRGADSAEFEAGVFALANLPEDAIRAYWRGIANHPGRIEIYLLLGNLLRDGGETQRGIGMFQYLAEHAERDDLFTIAIDGLLNLRAGPPVLRWARRITLERLARSGDKVYLYRLLADLSDELGDDDRVLDALEGTLASAGTQRASMLRELMDRSAQSNRSKRQLAYGRRLIGLGEVVPPQVYLDLGKAFLDEGDLTAARRTFGLASALPNGERFQRDVAKLFEDARYLDEALRIYRRVLVSSTGDLELMAKVCELQEQTGDDRRAFELAERALELLLVREPLLDSKETDDEPQNTWFGNRNVDDFSTYYTRLVRDLLATVSEDRLADYASRQLDLFRSEVDQARRDLELAEDESLPQLANTPRLRRRANLVRRLLFASDQIDRSSEFDLGLLRTFATDETILEEALRYRLDRGYLAAARALFDRSERPADQKAEVAAMVGRGEFDSDTRFGVAQILQQLVPAIQAGDSEQLAQLVKRLDPARITDEEEQKLPVVLAAANLADAPAAYVQVARIWVQRLVAQSKNAYQVRRILDSVAPFLSDEQRSEFARTIAGVILLDVEKSKDLMTLLPRLQEDVETPLATPEELLSLLDEQENAYAFTVVPVLKLLPADQRAIALQSIWSKVAETQRASFLQDLVESYEEPIDEEFETFLVDSFQGALKDVPEYFWWSVQRVGEKAANPGILLRFAELMCERAPDKVEPKSLRTRMLLRLGRIEEAVATAGETLVSGLGLENDYEWNSLVRSLKNEFPSSAYDELVGIVEKEADNSIRSVLRRVELLETFERSGETLALLDRAIDENPEDLSLRSRRQRVYARNGRFDDSIAELGELIRLETDDQQRERRRRSLVNLWLGQGHPINALEATKIGVEDGDDAANETDVESVDEEQVDSGAGDLERVEPASIQSVAEAVWEDDLDTAQLRFRRLWRFGSMLRSSFRYVNGVFVEQNFLFDPNWPTRPDPESAEASEPEDLPVRLGGLVDHRKPKRKVEKSESENAFEVLAGYEFGRDELRRVLRTLDARSVAQLGSIPNAIANHRIEDSGLETALDRVLTTVESGRGGHVDLAILTAMLEIDPTAEPERVQALSSEFARTVEPDAASAIRRLARLLAATGAENDAARLFRWCAALFAAEANQDVAPKELLADVRELFEGDQQIELIDAVLQLADPGAEPWEMEGYETLVLQTWEDVLGPDRALERCRELCEGLTDVTRVLRREPAKIAARLYARVGELDQAVDLLEIALCKLPTDDVLAEDFYLDRYSRPGYWSLSDLQTWFPDPAMEPAPEDGTEAGEEAPEAEQRRLDWVERGGDALIGWLDEDRIQRNQVTRAMLLLAVQLFEGGRTEAAERFLEFAQRQEEPSSSDRLWIADALRVFGRDTEADRIELDLLQDRELIRGRIAPVLERIATRQGADRALQVGERLVEWTLDERMLQVLIGLAKDSGRPELVMRYEALAAESRAAAEELKARGVNLARYGVRTRAAATGSTLIRIR